MEGDRLGIIADSIEGALQRGGLQFSAYAIGDDGFAYVAIVERIRIDGTPLKPPQRFPNNVVTDNGSDGWLDFIVSRFRVTPGYYRIIAVTVTNRPLQSAGAFPSLQASLSLVHGGMFTLPDVLRQKTVKGLQFAALVYEYERRGTQTGTVTARQAPLVSARVHLARAGMWNASQLR